MSVQYSSILWNRFKKRYDRILIAFMAMYIIAYFLFNKLLFPEIIVPTLIIRSFGTLALLLLHIVLAIGPLSRINSSFLPYLYNRRHLGVLLFFTASVHAVFSLVWFHGFSDYDPIYSLFTANTHYNSLVYFPFQVLGFVAYLILMLMAFTSHDFWLNFLSPFAWKSMHMLVYLAYGLIILHVVLGIIQFEESPVLASLLLLGLLGVTALHVLAGFKEFTKDKQKNLPDSKGWFSAGPYSKINEGRANIINIRGERVAVFKYDGKISAVHNVCKHQNGPLGEGKIVDGCITCPWHGYQYRPDDGCAPHPFAEKLATYRVKLIENEVFVYGEALPEGTPVEPALLPGHVAVPAHKTINDFFIGWKAPMPDANIRFLKRSIPTVFFIGLAVATSISLFTHKVSASHYDFNEIITLKGELLNAPFPALRTVSKDAYGNPKVALHPLVNEGKHGADATIEALFSKSNSSRLFVSLKGRLIQRDGNTAIEIAKGTSSIALLPEKLVIPPVYQTPKKDSVIIGQIIDPKCYLGVMNPGEGKPHRACAINCIRGGIMPAFITENSVEKKYFVLLGENGEKINNQVLFAVAEPVELKGKAQKIDNWNVFYLNPQTGIKRLTVQ